MYQFNFPPIKAESLAAQLLKIQEEVQEVEAEVLDHYVIHEDNRAKIIEETLDVIQACETLLHLVAKSNAEVSQIHSRVYAKNKRRGYYE